MHFFDSIFLWRRPESSWTYGMALGVIFLITATLPAQVLAKLVYLLIGFAFWFVTPVIAALTPEERSRYVQRSSFFVRVQPHGYPPYQNSLPPAFNDAPTDADYAIDIIAMRTARGERVVPAKPKKSKAKSGGNKDMGSVPASVPPGVGDGSASTVSLVESSIDDNLSSSGGVSAAPTFNQEALKESKGQKWNRFITKGVALTDQSLRIIQGEARPPDKVRALS